MMFFTMNVFTITTPAGKLRIHLDLEGNLTGIDFIGNFAGKTNQPKQSKFFTPAERASAANLPGGKKVFNQLYEYFQGKRVKFDLPLKLEGTDFQQKVWRELLAIPYGKTRTYGEVARRLKRPQASRAVGAANRRNPIPIVIPCHRVIGANGKLTGFAGGLDRKQVLLSRENRENLF